MCLALATGLNGNEIGTLGISTGENRDELPVRTFNFSNGLQGKRVTTGFEKR